MSWVENLRVPNSWDIDPIPPLTIEQQEQVGIGIYVFVMVIGVLLVFFGQRLARSLLTSAGAFIFFVLGWAVLSSVTSYNMYIVVVMAFPISLLGALIFSLCLWVAIWFLGAFLGFITSASFLNIGVSGSPLFNYLWVFSFSYLGGIVSVMFKDLELIVGSSLLGGYWIALGFDRLILHSGYTDTISGIIYYFVRMEYSQEAFAPVPKTEWFWVLLGSSLTLAFIGSLVQWKFTANIQDKVEESVEIEMKE